MQTSVDSDLRVNCSVELRAGMGSCKSLSSSLQSASNLWRSGLSMNLGGAILRRALIFLCDYNRPRLHGLASQALPVGRPQKLFASRSAVSPHREWIGTASRFTCKLWRSFYSMNGDRIATGVMSSIKNDLERHISRILGLDHTSGNLSVRQNVRN